MRRADPTSSTTRTSSEGRSSMVKNRRLLSLVAVAAAALALAVGGGLPASADPTGTPGAPYPGKTATEIYAGVGADAFAELTNELAVQYNATNPVHVISSYDAINPVNGNVGESITTKPGCTVARPNGANGGINVLKLNATASGDASTYCVDFVRSSRSRAASDTGLTFYAQSRDAVSYAVIGNAYAPTTPLTTAQLKRIFTCKDEDWSAVGGQAGAIHLYLPPSTAATYTFFLQAIGITDINDVTTGCGASNPNVHVGQQNDGTSMLGDPQGILPYAVTKWGAQANNAPGILDLRGGAQIGLVNTTTQPLVDSTAIAGHTYKVLNPAFASGDSTSFGRFFFNVVRTSSTPPELAALFGEGGYLCQHADALLIPFGNTPLGDAHTGDQWCGRANS
jgi:ABC-type phosphate transport system substrate-binding protein